MTTAIDKLEYNHKIAEALYIGKASDETFARVFTPIELEQLWLKKCVFRVDEDGNLQSTASYDDEVYNALDRYGYWDNK